MTDEEKRAVQVGRLAMQVVADFNNGTRTLESVVAEIREIIKATAS